MARSPKREAPARKRVLIKISGEALMGDAASGIDVAVTDRIARDLKAVSDQGMQICLVVGGGNIFRGMAGVAQGMERAAADYMGMLATVMNAIAVQNALERIGTPARVLSAIPMPTVCESFIRPRAVRHLEKGRVVIFAAGTGNPYFTTDTAAALRASEMACDAMVKWTQVDGVYSADPKRDPGAQRYERLSYADVLARDLKVMDGAAIALARDNDIPIIVCSMGEEGGLPRVLRGEGRYTVVSGAA
ncbi:MAG: UMP kinase [Pseudomonadota bacterium]|nr:UMP kinase [Pseudomonadota bacterium]